MPKILYVTAVSETQYCFLKGQNHFMRRNGFILHSACSPDHRLNELVQRDGVCAHPVYISRRVSPLRDLVSLIQIYLIVRAVSPDIAHISTPKASLLASIACWAARVPVRVFLVRGLATESASGAGRSLTRICEWATACLCSRIVFVSESLRLFAAKERIVPLDRGVVLGAGMSNGIDTDRFNSEGVLVCEELRHHVEAGGKVVGFVGRLAHSKGIDELAEAWGALRSRFNGLKLILVGDWDKDDVVNSKTRAILEADERVIITGRVSDVRPYLKAMNVFVFPSHREGFPNAPMEAAAMGLPVVATRVSGCVDAVHHGVTGTLVPAYNHELLSSAISDYLSSGSLCLLHGTAGRHRVRKLFNSHLLWKLLLNEYAEELAKQGIEFRHPADPSIKAA